MTKRQALPASGLGRRPDAEGRSEKRPQQNQIEDGAGAKPRSEDEISRTQLIHALGKEADSLCRFATER
jgi:hypothetical protein